jgi:hypothetical protein
MRKILIILSFLIPVFVFSQNEQYIGTPQNIVKARGGLMSDSSYYLPLRDTNFIPIRYGSEVMRPQDYHIYKYVGHWVVSDSTVAGANFYNTSSSFTSNRTANSGGNSLTFLGTNGSEVFTINQYPDIIIQTTPSLPYASLSLHLDTALLVTVNSSGHGVGIEADGYNVYLADSSTVHPGGSSRKGYVFTLLDTITGRGTWKAGSAGTLTNFSSGNLSPLFTTSVATATSTPALSFTLSNAAANSILGNNTGGSAAPTYFVPTSTTLNGWFGSTIQSAISLTTTGSSGAATFSGNTLNIPNYSGGGTTTNAATFNNSGGGGSSGSTFNGSSALTISYNTIGAAPLASPSFTGTLGAQGLKTNLVAKTSTYNIATTDYTIECSTNSFTVTLPTAVGVSGQQYVVANITSTTTITVATTSSQTFLNQTGTPTTVFVSGLGSLTFQSDGTGWLIE